MFTIEQIELAQSKMESGAEFPKFIQEIKNMGVMAFVTYVKDSHTEYFGDNNFQTQSYGKYDELLIENNCKKDKFLEYLKIHQKGETNYLSFCKHCAETGIEKWTVDLKKMTCTYYDKAGNEILIEKILTV